ncbi:hypothetical protein DN730_06995 [Marinomonas piezotolerans]|uniref:Uncharacterized protein n=1 Tax=Marinomonas piezotolerans TaxID=2213058 RepID=A0A370UC71_9GAMM|nr:hypothetical protein [Marinomonas piezotolerans]RDL45348.1 hypothetical protein DN730_06995 [Marinomonas piezotolerans]
MSKRLPAPFIGVALIAGAAWVAVQSYQQHFSGPLLSDAEQAKINVSLLSFPRPLPALHSSNAGKWFVARLQPDYCDAICQGDMAQSKSWGIKVITPQAPTYDDIETTLSAPNYSAHQGKVLLINPEGEFAGSLQPPYSARRVATALEKLNK